MSIEIYRATEGDCVCPYPHSDGTWRCRHWWQCEWGQLKDSDPRPDRGHIGHLMVTTPDYVSFLDIHGPRTWERKGGRIDSVSACGGRAFMHCDWNGQRWTWELFDAHFRDKPDFGLLIGRWPD